MPFSEFKAPLLALLKDSIEVGKFLDSGDSQCARRMSIRSLFTYFEGSVWIIKQACVKATCEVCRKVKNPGREGLLLDESYEVDANGTIKIRPRFTPIASNLRFAFTTFEELAGCKIDLMIGTHHWQNFKTTIEVHNRITHPRQEEDLFITDEELEKSEDAGNRFNGILHEAIASMVGNRIEGK